MCDVRTQSTHTLQITGCRGTGDCLLLFHFVMIVLPLSVCTW